MIKIYEFQIENVFVIFENVFDAIMILFNTIKTNFEINKDKIY